MKHFLKTAALVLAAGTLLLSCAGSLVNLKYENKQFVNKRLGLAYNAAPTCYQPYSIGEPYGYFKDSDMTLYQIIGTNPKEWLSQELAGSATTIFYDEDITLPTIETMGADRIYLCTNTEATAVVAIVDDQALVDQVVDLFVNGADAEWPLIDSDLTLDIKFYSEENYPFLFYNLQYGEFPEGNFIYDRTTKRCVEVGGVFADYVK